MGGDLEDLKKFVGISSRLRKACFQENDRNFSAPHVFVHVFDLFGGKGQFLDCFGVFQEEFFQKSQLFFGRKERGVGLKGGIKFVGISRPFQAFFQGHYRCRCLNSAPTDFHAGQRPHFFDGADAMGIVFQFRIQGREFVSPHGTQFLCKFFSSLLFQLFQLVGRTKRQVPGHSLPPRFLPVSLDGKENREAQNKDCS